MSATEVEILKTRQRILDIAGEVFAEQGFKNATIREICRRAEANVAAVNYHFRDKQALYSEIFRLSAREALAKYPPDMGIDASATAEQKLHAFIRSFFWRIFDTGRPAWFGKLMAREMVEPTHALDERVNEMMRPMAERLSSILKELAPAATTEQLGRCSCSVVGQIVFYHHCRPVIDKLFPGQRRDAAEIDRLADHVTQFSLAALHEMAKH